MGKVEAASHDPFLDAPSYDLLNLRLGLMFERHAITTTFWGRNVLDEEYQSFGFEPLAMDGKILAMPGEPRTYGITLRKDF